MIHGMIAVWKEQDFTSHDVVAKLRGILRQKKIGHTGTLDPKAEGVLLVGLGIGTKLCDLLTDKRKIYEAEMILGTETDTQDIWGQVIEEGETKVDENAFQQAIMSFVGTYHQIPPMYSAKKVDGKKLYELARKGQVIERKAVPVTIHQIEILELESSRARFLVSCSEGTYIRTLCSDIGRKLGTVACMSALTRVSACGFDKSQALTLAEIEQARDEGTLMKWIVPVDEALKAYPVLTVKKEYTKNLVNGNSFGRSMLYSECGVDNVSEAFDLKPNQEYRIYLENTGFIGLYFWDQEKERMIPHKIFYRTEV